MFGALVGAWIPHIPDVKNGLGLTNGELGNALLASGVGATAIMPVTGSIIHRFGSRRVSLGGAWIACALVPLLIREHSVLGLGLNLFALGLAYGCLDVAMNAHSVAVQKLHPRPILSGIHGWFSLGGFVGGGGAALAAKIGVNPQIHLLVNSLLMAALVGLAAHFLLPNDVDRDTEGPRFVLPSGVLLVIGVMCLFAFVAEGGSLDWAAVYLRNARHATESTGAVATSLTSFAMAAGRLLGDSIVHRYGERKVLICSGVATALGFILAANLSYPPAAIGGFVLSGFGAANIVPVLFNIAGRRPGVSPGTGLAAVTTCGYAGFLLGPPAIGYLADWQSLPFSVGTLALLGLGVVVLTPLALGG